MAARENLSDLNLSEDEIARLSEAFKKEDFRKLFAEYAQEISDPVNKQRYEAEISQMEAERGMDIKFIRPEPGHVIKTTVSGDTKAFINICKNEYIEKPSSNKQKTSDGRFGLQWSIPHSFAPPRDDTDKKGEKCKVFDVVFNPDTYRMGETNVRFRQMLHDTAFDGIERQFELTVDRKNVKFPKMKFKGVASSTVIRTKSEAAQPTDTDGIMSSFPYPYDNKTTEEKSREHREKVQQRKEKSEKNSGSKISEDEQRSDNDPFTKPKYTIKHRNEIELDQFRNAPDARPSTRPKELVIEIDLPLLKSAAAVDLDIFEKKMQLKSEKPAKYKLDLNLPYPVDDNAGSAKFDKSKKRLIVTLPVLPDNEVQNFFDEIRNIGHLPSDQVNDAPESGKNEEGKPLIEVLSSVDAFPDSKTTSDAQLETNENISVPEVSDDRQEVESFVEQKNKQNSDETSKDIWSVEEAGFQQRQQVLYQLPEFDYDQDVGSVTLVLHVKNVEPESVTKTFVPHDPRRLRVTFVSLGAGLFPIHYSLVLCFQEVRCVDVASPQFDLHSSRVVFSRLQRSRV